jgi:hypothetical protein
MRNKSNAGLSCGNVLVPNLSERPWDLREVASKYYGDFIGTRKAIRELQGFKALELIYALKRTYSLLSSYVEDLTKPLDIFESNESDFGLSQAGAEIEGIRFEVSKATFSITCAASSLRDIQRRVRDKCGLQKEYEAKRIQIFGDANIEDFIYDLRNFSLHRAIIDVDWQVSSDFITGVTERIFILRKDKLLSFKKWKSNAKLFIDSHDNIDIRKSVCDFCSLARSFNDWLISLVYEKESDEIKECAAYEKTIFCASLARDFRVCKDFFNKNYDILLSGNDMNVVYKEKDLCQNSVALYHLVEDKYGINLIDFIFENLV